MAGGVIDGQAVNQSVTNAAFIYKNFDDSTFFKLTLNDSDISLVSGTQVTNVQKDHNALWSFIGGSINQVKNYLPTWTSNNFGLMTDNLKERVEAIDANAVTLATAKTVSIKYAIVFGK